MTTEKLIIYKRASDKSKECLSVGNSGYLSVVISVLAPAYTSLCRNLELSLEVQYVILVDLLRDGSLVANTVFCYRVETLPNV